jgi:hypothetical protein
VSLIAVQKYYNIAIACASCVSPVDISCETLKQLNEQEPELFISGQGKRFMLSSQDDSLSLVEFASKRAIASLWERAKPN